MKNVFKLAVLLLAFGATFTQVQTSNAADGYCYGSDEKCMEVRNDKGKLKLVVYKKKGSPAGTIE